MEFETQYKVFVVSLILGVIFYVAGGSLTSAMLNSENFLPLFFIELGIKIAIFIIILLASLFLLGIGTILGPYIPRLADVHLVYAHLTLLSSFAVYGIYLTADNLSIYFNGFRLVELLPFFVPKYVSILGLEIMTRHFLILLAVLISAVKDIIDIVRKEEVSEEETKERKEVSKKPEESEKSEESKEEGAERETEGAIETRMKTEKPRTEPESSEEEAGIEGTESEDGGAGDFEVKDEAGGEEVEMEEEADRNPLSTRNSTQKK